MKNSEHNLYKKALAQALPDAYKTKAQILRDAKEEMHSRKKISWAIPAACCILAAVVICIAVPPVRAAIQRFFDREYTVQNYVAKPQEERLGAPELETAINATMTQGEDENAVSSVEILNVVPKWQAWADSLSPQMGDILFDGDKLIASFDMGGGARELLMGRPVEFGGDALRYEISFGNLGYMALNGQKYAYNMYSEPTEPSFDKFAAYYDEDFNFIQTEESLSAVDSATSVPCAVTVDFKENHSPFQNYSGLSEQEKADMDEYISEAQAFDPAFIPSEIMPAPEGRLEGIQHVEISLPLMLVDYGAPEHASQEVLGATYTATQIGLVKLTFSFDPAFGYESKQLITGASASAFGEQVVLEGAYPFMFSEWNESDEASTLWNEELDLSGAIVTGTEIEIGPAETLITATIEPPAHWDDETLHSVVPYSIGLSLLGDGQNLPYGGEFGITEAGSRTIVAKFELNMLPSEIRQISEYTLVPYVSFLADSEGKQVPLGQKMSGKDGWKTESILLEEYAIKFTID